jgi:hypothetical protein
VQELIAACAAVMLAEIGDCQDRYPSYRELAADTG